MVALLSSWRNLSKGFHPSYLCFYPTSHSRPSWRTRYRGSRPSATRAYRSLQGVIEKSVEPPKCYILIFFHWLMRYPASHYLRYQDNNQWRHLLWSFSHTDYATHKKKYSVMWETTSDTLLLQSVSSSIASESNNEWLWAIKVLRYIIKKIYLNTFLLFT